MFSTRLRLLLGLTLIVAVVLSCHVVRLQRARLQHESAAKVREMDGVCHLRLQIRRIYGTDSLRSSKFILGLPYVRSGLLPRCRLGDSCR